MSIVRVLDCTDAKDHDVPRTHESPVEVTSSHQ